MQALTERNLCCMQNLKAFQSCGLCSFTRCRAGCIWLRPTKLAWPRLCRCASTSMLIQRSISQNVTRPSSARWSALASGHSCVGRQARVAPCSDQTSSSSLHTCSSSKRLLLAMSQINRDSWCHVFAVSPSLPVVLVSSSSSWEIWKLSCMAKRGKKIKHELCLASPCYSQHGKKRDQPLAVLEQFFHLPIDDASRVLGICSTSLKLICRKHGLVRWPYRKVMCTAFTWCLCHHGIEGQWMISLTAIQCLLAARL